MTAAGVWLVLGLAAAIAGSRMQLGTLAAPGSGFLPMLSGLVLTGLGAVVLYTEWQAARQGVQPPRPAIAPGARLRVIGTMIALVAYGLLLDVLGFAVTTFLLLGVLFRSVGKLGWLAALGWTIGGTVFSHVLFRVWLKVPFPPGPWGF